MKWKSKITVITGRQLAKNQKTENVVFFLFLFFWVVFLHLLPVRPKIYIWTHGQTGRV